MNDLSKFKIAILGIFVFSILFGLFSFATSRGGSGSGSSSANLLVWGTIDSEVFDSLYSNSTIKNQKSIEVKYVRKNAVDFQQDFVEALSDGKGPDVIILREDLMYQNRNKILNIPYKNYSARDFKDRFIENGEIFLAQDGIVALPIIVDPMVMYWNRDIFSNNQIAQPPKYWDEFYLNDTGSALISKITKKDSNANILLSAVALGEWKNIVNAKEIFSMILIQTGSSITAREDDKVVSTLDKTNSSVSESQLATNFYTQFSNPTSATYTWNRALPSSLNMFLVGNLATYIGFSSELFNIKQKNSNLNFDVTYVPQIRNASKKVVFGHIYGASIVKQSKQTSAAFTFIVSLTEPAALKAAEVTSTLPPVRRDLLSDKPSDAYRTVFYDSALISRSWIDPDPVQSSETFKDMIESITSGKSRISDAINRADSELAEQLK